MLELEKMKLKRFWEIHQRMLIMYGLMLILTVMKMRFDFISKMIKLIKLNGVIILIKLIATIA